MENQKRKLTTKIKGQQRKQNGNSGSEMQIKCNGLMKEIVSHGNVDNNLFDRL